MASYLTQLTSFLLAMALLSSWQCVTPIKNAKVNYSYVAKQRGVDRGFQEHPTLFILFCLHSKLHVTDVTFREHRPLSSIIRPRHLTQKFEPKNLYFKIISVSLALYKLGHPTH